MDQSGQPRTNSSRKSFNENIKNQPLLPNKYKKINRSLQKNEKKGKEKLKTFQTQNLFNYFILLFKLNYQSTSALLKYRSDSLACVVDRNVWTRSAKKSQKAVEGLDSQNKEKV